jgi:hypothetical protein
MQTLVVWFLCLHDCAAQLLPPQRTLGLSPPKPLRAGLAAVNGPLSQRRELKEVTCPGYGGAVPHLHAHRKGGRIGLYIQVGHEAEGEGTTRKPRTCWTFLSPT